MRLFYLELDVSRAGLARKKAHFGQEFQFFRIKFLKFQTAILSKWLEILPIFFIIIAKDEVFYILVEFERDRVSPRESPKNGRTGAHGLKCIIFVNSELKFEIYD